MPYYERQHPLQRFFRRSLQIETSGKNPIDPVKDRCNEVNTILYSWNLEPTVSPLGFFRIYNFLKANPLYSKDELEQERLALVIVNSKEKAYRRATVPLPTIGIELEYPRKKSMMDEQEKVFSESGIPNQHEVQDYWEIYPHFAYSPAVTESILIEMTKFGVLPTHSRPVRYRIEEGTNYTIPPFINEGGGDKVWVRKEPRGNGSLSLHINLGVPPTVDTNQVSVFELNTLSSMLAFAYASPERIESRKTQIAFKWNDAKPNDKTEDSAKGNPKRLEIRTTEFRDNTTYRLLYDAQLLIGCLFAYKGSGNNNLKTTWDLFYENAEVFEKKFNLYKGIINTDGYALAKRMRKNPLIQKEAFEIVSTFAGLAAELIWKEQLTPKSNKKEHIIFPTTFQI